MAQSKKGVLLSLQPAIRQLKKLGHHGLAGAFHSLAMRILDNPAMDDSVKETLLGQLILIADFKTSERLAVKSAGPRRKRPPRPRSRSPLGPSRKPPKGT